MKIKFLQWNIGGGRVCAEGKDPTSPESYTEYGIDSIIDVLKDEQPDIITLQETHESSGYCQTQIIADALGYSYWVNDSYDDSFIEKGQRFGQGVISRYPITEHYFTAFTNPNFNLTRTHLKNTLPLSLARFAPLRDRLPISRKGANLAKKSREILLNHYF